jgi:hypothetical protein
MATAGTSYYLYVIIPVSANAYQVYRYDTPVTAAQSGLALDTNALTDLGELDLSAPAPSP